MVPGDRDSFGSCLTRGCMAWVVAVQTMVDYRRTALEEVKTKLFREARGRRQGGFRMHLVEQHLPIAVAVLTEASPYRPSDLSSGVGKGSVPRLAGRPVFYVSV